MMKHSGDTYELKLQSPIPTLIRKGQLIKHIPMHY